MKKLRTVIYYECATSFKYIWIFYACVLAVISIFSTIVYINTGSLKDMSASCLEGNTFIYVGFLGVLGFKEDFKMLIQNGFTRKCIFLSTFALFTFVSAIMALVDTIIGRVLHDLSDSYYSLFGSLYGYGHSAFLNWLWLFLVYMLVCSLLYLVILTVNRLGKTMSIFAGVALVLVFVLLMPAIFKYALPEDFATRIIELAVKGMGFMSGGTVNFIYPLLLLAAGSGILSGCSYLLIERTELFT